MLKSIRFVLVFAGLLVCSESALAQVYFFNKLEMPTGKGPQSLAVGDFNKDGMPDFAVANTADNTISVFLGKVDGTFQALTAFSTGAATAPSAVISADFNGDGNLDLAVALNGANTVAVFTGKGDGTFNAATSFATGTGPVALAMGDFNGDKKTDLAIANYTASSVTVLLNTSSGNTVSFSPAAGSPFATGANPTSIAVADFNADKKLDLAVSNFTGQDVTILLGSGSGSFTAATTVTVGQPLQSIVAGDIDGDGKVDLVTGTVGQVFVLLGNGDGTFSSILYGVPNNSGAYAMLAVDINGDKKLDLLTVDRDKFDDLSTFTVCINNSTKGNPSFVFPAVHYAAGFQAAAIGLADFNHDGKTDAVVANQGANTVSILLGDGKGHFDPQVTTATGARQPNYMTSADFNNDHKEDLAISNTFGGTNGNGVVEVLLGKGNGTFTATEYQVGNVSQGIVAADLNGDGASDLAVVNNSDNTVSVMINDKTGKFPATSPTYVTGKAPVALAAGNFRLTGHIDLAVVNHTDSTISILPNDGTGKFGSPSTLTLPSNSGPTSIVAGDFNGDGHPDLAVGDGNSVLVFINNGGAFGSPTNINLNLQPLWIATASLRNNGTLDLVVAYNSGVDVLLGKGNGTFAAPVSYPTPSNSETTSVTIGDLNADGIPDLLLANTGASTGGVMLGKGDGTFLPEIRYQTSSPTDGGGTTSPVAVVVGDFNNDSFNDFVVLDGDGHFTFYPNTPAAAVWPTTLKFPTLQLGQTSAAQTGNLYNSGVATLKPTVKITPADYVQTSNTCGKTLATGATCAVSVTFSPQDINARNGSISISDNATVTPQKITLSGTGSEVNVSPDPVQFGNVAHGSSATQTVTIKNLSGGGFPAHNLTFNSIAVSGTDFSLTNDGCPVSPAFLAPQATCQVKVQFAPAAKGSFSGALTVTDNGGGSPQKIGMSGTGT
jgi:hypothetical protein